MSVRSCASLALLVPFLVCCCSSENGDVDGPDGSGNGPIGVGVDPPRPSNLPMTIEDSYELPEEAAIGDWVERRHTDPQGATWVERIAIVGGDETGLWVEVTENRTFPEHPLIRRRRVDRAGKVHEGTIGFAGESGQPLEILAARPFAADEPDAVEEATVSVAAGTFECTVEIYGEAPDVWKDYRSPEVPFDRLVRSESPDEIIELLRFGRDARSQLGGE